MKNSKSQFKIQSNNSRLKKVIVKRGKRQLLVNGAGEYVVELGEEGAAVKVLGVVVARGKAMVEVKVRVKHKAAKTKAEVVIYGVVKEEARLKLAGLLEVEKKARFSESNLVERVLVLGEKAGAEAVPNLEIKNSEVKVSHAVAIGRISEEEIFYLMSRGLDRSEAERMIVKGFFEPVLARIEDRNLRTSLHENLVPNIHRDKKKFKGVSD